MARKRRHYGAEFKAKVSIEAPEGELTIAQLVGKHRVHQMLLSSWKQQAVEGRSAVFSNAM